MRITPCESVPRRLAHTSILAHSPACSRVRPDAVKIAAVKLCRSVGEMRRESELIAKAYTNALHSSFRDARSAVPESILRSGGYGFRARPCGPPRNDAGETRA